MAKTSTTPPTWLARHTPLNVAVSVIPLAVFAFLLSLLPRVAAGEVLRFSVDWVPQLGIQLGFAVDGLGLLFGLIISGIGTLVVLYASSYLEHDSYLVRFYILILIFMGSMLGVVFSANLIGLVVFWELTSISSFLLIGYKHDYADSRYAAQQALIVTGLGGLALLGGAIMLGLMAGSFEIDTVIAQADAIRAHALYPVMLTLVLLGAFTKSAQFPFHFWLPGAMAAPTPVSAYLHSATMVKAGVFLLARLSPALGGTALWQTTVTTIGLITFLLGAFTALPQRDLKRILAYSTVSILGALTMLLGIGDKLTVKAAMVLVLAHALYKGTMFLVAGIIDHATGTRDVTRLGGLWRVMPFTFAGAALAGLSMAGFPPMLGYLSKEVLYEALEKAAFAPHLWVLAGTILAKTLMVAIAAYVVIGSFLGPRQDTPQTPHAAPWRLWLGPLTLGTLGLVLGLFPGLIDATLISPAMSATLATPTTVELKLWHGFNLVFWLSAATLVVGSLLFVVRRPVQGGLMRLQLLDFLGPSTIYGHLLNALPRVALSNSRLWQDNSLGYYIRVFVLGTVALVIWQVGPYVLGSLGSVIRLPANTMTWYEWLMPLVIIVTSLAISRLPSRRVSAIVMLGGVGFAVAVIFFIYGAPDLAMTQLAVETLVVILIVLIINRMPRSKSLSSNWDRVRDFVVAGSAGLTMTLLVLVVVGVAPPLEVSTFFALNSYLEAFGQNVVNVILVDFRGLDTMGEIVVLALAALGVYALLKLRSPHGTPTEPTEEQQP